MMTERLREKTWLTAIAEAAKEQGISLPPFHAQGMGNARSVILADGRYITFKRRLVPAAQAEVDGVEWALWLEQDDLPTLIAAFRETLVPKQEIVNDTLSLLKGWLVEGWTPAEAKLAVGRHRGAQVVEELPPPRQAMNL
jgi:hypothetical protein